MILNWNSLSWEGIINVENECEITFKNVKSLYIYKSDSESETVHFMLGIPEPFYI